MSYKIRWETNGALIKLSGTVKIDDFLESNNQFYGDPRFDTMQYQLVDGLDFDVIDISEEDIKVVSTLDKTASRWNREIKVAFILKDKIAIELANEYSKGLEGSGWQTAIFESEKEARNWIQG